VARSTSFSDTDVATAALSVIDREGLNAFTMRNVARELGVAPMSLYRYVRNREHLEELIVDLLMSDVALTVPKRSSWRRQMTILIERVRAVVEMHPNVMPLALPHRLTSGSGLRLSETVYQILSDAGFNGSEREIANRSLMVYLLGSIQLELYGSLSRTGTTGLSNMSAVDYPLLFEASRKRHMTNPSRQFLSGLNVVFDGLEASQSTARTKGLDPRA
jgi:AcrR family transcriptional regulator